MVALGCGVPSADLLRAQEPPARKHIEITGSERLRITYESTFVWPGGGGYSAVMDLPIPPDTGGQHIESFTSSLKGAGRDRRRGPSHPDRDAAP